MVKAGKITVMPDGTIKALDSNKQVYVYLPNVICDEYGECPLFIEGNRQNRYCIFDLTNDAIADSAKKIRGRHGRTRLAQEKEAQKQKDKLKKEKLKARELARKTKKQFSRSKLIKEADRVFSLYIRGRDSGKPCCTCGTPWTENAQCGHFMSRRHYQTRWTAHNAHGQCYRCNMLLSGEQYKHGEFIAEKYGIEFPGLLRSLCDSSHKVTDSEIFETIQHYYKKCFELGIDYKPKKQFYEI